MPEGPVSAVPILQAGTAEQEVVIVVSATAKVTGHVVMAEKPVAGAAVVVLLGAGVGITAGASTPEELVSEIVEKLRQFRNIAVSYMTGIEEHIQFKLPDQLRAA